MRTQFLLVALSVFLFVGGPAFAQGPCSSQSSKLSCVIPQMYGLQPGEKIFDFGKVLFVAQGPNFHPAHFNPEFGSQLGPLTSAIGRQANLLPLASPSSGVLLTYDSSLKTFAVSTDSSLGPILGERGETVGRHKLFIGFSSQFFDFDKIDGVNLRSIPVVLPHRDDGADNSNPPGSNPCSIAPANGSSDLGGCAFVRDAFYSQNSIDLKINQYTGYITFGLSSHVDVSMVIPFESVRMSLYSQSTIVLGSDGSFTPVSGSPDTLILNQNVTPTRPTSANGAPYFFHLFQDCPDTSPATGAAGLDPKCLHHTFPDPNWTGSGSSSVNSSSGVGDIVARVKWNALSRERLKFATGLDVRFPTGDALNYLGSGSYGVKPFVVLSYRARVSPHAMVGYEWNSNSILSARINVVPSSFGPPSASIGLLTGQKGYMPSDFLYTAGVDAWITKWLTGSFDVVGARILRGGTEAVTPHSFPAPCSAGCLTDPSPSTVSSPSLAPNNDASYSVTNASMGVKIRPIPKVSKLVLTANVLVRLDNGGLHSKPAPLVGLGYTF